MMDSFEVTKIAGAVLTALLIIFGTKTIIEINTSGHGHGESHQGYVLPVADAGAAPAKSGGAVPPAFDPAAIAAAAATADASAGETVFKKCAACHKVGEGAKNGTGPMLNGIVGRAAGTVEGYRYSKPMQDAGAGGMVWDAANLRSYLADPKGFIPKNKMSFAGLKKDEDLDAVIAYLATFGG